MAMPPNSNATATAAATPTAVAGKALVHHGQGMGQAVRTTHEAQFWGRLGELRGMPRDDDWTSSHLLLIVAFAAVAGGRGKFLGRGACVL